MPWHIVPNSSQCPSGKPYAVIKDQDGSVAGCHATKAKAQKQLAALYANEPQANKESEMSDSTRPLGEDIMRAEQVLRAAEHGDHLAFAALAQRIGLEEAQEIVRTRGLVRMVDRVAPSRLRIGAPFEMREAMSESAEPTLFGHFAVFNEPTEIDSLFEGRFIEQIAPGSFKKTFAENRDSMRVLFQHGMDPQIGDKPLGPIDRLQEDETGGYYEVPLLDAPYVRNDVLPGLRANLYGASFRFRVMREEFNNDPDPSDHNPDGLPERTIKEAQVMEFGPVTFPAYPAATAGIRANGESAGEELTVAPSTVDAAGEEHLGEARRRSETGTSAKERRETGKRRPPRDYLAAEKEDSRWRL